ncbi:MAG: cystathionine beta-lyase [Neisseriaceae bacterium]|nr:cystathionine beta-lyase [Neisseriaceae bacterium]MBP6862580.1 cystathionine beta-lyase [Neisseriaceae bacterium]
MSVQQQPDLALATQLVHLGSEPSDQYGFVNTPVYRGSTVVYPDYQHLKQRDMPFGYGTDGTPTVKALEDAWTTLSGAAGTVISPSGLGSISLALLSVLKAGDHLLMTDSAYRPTRILCEGMLKRFGVTTTYYDPTIGSDIAALVQPNTRVIFTESPGSQSLEIQDIPAIVAVAKQHNIITMMDNTWATPIFFKAHAHGIDMVIEAGTKYLSGHSDLLMGLVSANAATWPALRETYDAMAMCPGPEDCFLALRGLRTMHLRLKEAEKQGLAMAKWLQARPEVAQVLHPALPDCPGHDLWRRDFLGSSGLFSMILKPGQTEQDLAAFLDGLKLFRMGFSWGGYESLIIPFDCKPYRTATAWQPGGIALRLQIGLEAIEDLQADLAAGFARLS